MRNMFGMKVDSLQDLEKDTKLAGMTVELVEIVEIVLITGHPNFSERMETLISVSFFSLMSDLFSATTTGMPSSISWVVKNRERLRLVASTILMMASGCSFLT